MATTSKEADKASEDSCRTTNILDLSIDNITQCASSLCMKDLENMAMTCKQLRDAVYVDSIWENQCRKRWPPKLVLGDTFQFCGGRKAYLERHVASEKFQFLDPIDWHIMPSFARASHILVEEDSITVAQGSSITRYDIDEPQKARYVSPGHCAQITCMRSVPSAGLLSSRSSCDGAGSLLVTSSMDHTIRIWRTDCLLRTFRGHSGPVTALSNSLLGGQYGMPTLASGGIDGTIRLWALSSGQKRGSSPLQKTFYGHELAVKQLAVTEYNPSLLVSAGKDLKLRVWDVTSTGALVCGSTKGPGVPVGLVCKESMCYVAGGSNLMLLDLRSMQTIATIAAHKCGILNFSTPVSGEAVCTGGAEKTAKLWDLRNVEEPYATLGGHTGDVNFVYMDHYKAVTGGFTDGSVYIWDTETGDQLTSLDNHSNSGLTTMTVKGTRVATGISGGWIQFRDFSNCTVPMRQNASDNDVEQTSKFWETSFQGVS